MKKPILSFFEENNLTPRDLQVNVLKIIEENWDKYDYFMLSLPTGVGKTYIADAIANVVNNAYIITSTIQLQNQYEKSWQQIVNLKGRGNYRCNLNPEFSVDCAPCLTQTDLIGDCMRNKTCSYYNQREKALSSRVMLTNPLYLLYSVHCGFASESSEVKAPQGVKREVLIVDECHNLESHLVSFAESKLNLTDLHETHGVKCAGLTVTGNFDHDYNVVKELQRLTAERCDYLKAKIEEEFPGLTASSKEKLQSWAAGITKKVAEKAAKLNKKLYEVDKVLQSINIFFQTHESPEKLLPNWMIHSDEKEKTITLTPLRAFFLFKHFFGKLANKFVFMSATLGTPDQFCNELGIEREKALFIESDTPFKPEKSPIIIFPLLKMGYKDIDATIPTMIITLDELMNTHLEERGIIHCSTYKIQNEILLKLPQKNRQRLLARDMIMQKKYNNQELLELHSKSKNYSVLLSPSMMEGIDLYDDLSTFQIILKFPWASLMNPRVKYKCANEKHWYENSMWINVMQASGRSTRHEEDYSVTYILDASFSYFFNKYKSQLPKWFKNRIVIPK